MRQRQLSLLLRRSIVRKKNDCSEVASAYGRLAQALLGEVIVRPRHEVVVCDLLVNFQVPDSKDEQPVLDLMHDRIRSAAAVDESCKGTTARRIHEWLLPVPRIES